VANIYIIKNNKPLPQSVVVFEHAQALIHSQHHPLFSSFFHFDHSTVPPTGLHELILDDLLKKLVINIKNKIINNKIIFKKITSMFTFSSLEAISVNLRSMEPLVVLIEYS
jgi:hypothetical protein